MDTLAGKGAKAFAEDWVKQHTSDGSTLILETYKDRTEKYGRYLARLRSTAGGDLARSMIDAQHAVPYMVNQ